MPPITTNTATTTGAQCCGRHLRTGKVYRVGRLGQIGAIYGFLLVMLFAPHSHSSSTAAIPVLYAANTPMVRQDSEVPGSATNDSARPTTGKDSWRKSLQARLSIQWEQVELKQIVTQAKWPGITVWCDRRIDTSRIVDLELQSQPLQRVVQALAEHCEIGLALHSGVVALVPKDQAATLPVILADARRQALELPSNFSRPWLESKDRNWPTLSQPNLLLAQWLEPLPKTWTLAELPHDLWDAGQLPRMALIEQVAFVAFGFGLRPVLSMTDAGPSLNFESIAADTVCTLPIDDAFQRGEFRKLKAEFARRYPALTARFDNNPQVSGPLHELGVLLATLEAQRPQPGAPQGESRYTIKLEGQPAESVIRFLAQQMQRDVSFEPDLPEANLTKPITLDAKEWTREKLVQEIGQQADLEIQVDATRIHVRLPPPRP